MLLEAGRHPRAATSVIFHWFSGTSDDLHRAVEARLLLFGGAAHAGLAARTRIRPADSLRSAAPGDRHARTRKDDKLPAEVWRAELDNALSGIAQLKGIDRAELAERIASTSRDC